MNRDEWHEELAARPLTPNQRGAIMREFARLGVSDRTERLTVSAALLGLAELGSTSELVMGQAGQLVNVLAGIRDATELADAARDTAAADESIEGDAADHGVGQGDEHGGEPRPRPTWLEALSRIAIAVHLAQPDNT